MTAGEALSGLLAFRFVDGRVRDVESWLVEMPFKSDARKRKLRTICS